MRRRYIHGSNVEAADPRGSIVAVTNYQGTALYTNSYDEYGIPDTASGNDIATKGRFRYTGQAWIPELGMYYYKARVYSPTLGRFLQTDPIGYEDQFNLYAYVGNDPVNGVDPSGLASIGGCGSRIEGVNNCSGDSYFAYEAAFTAHRAQMIGHKARDRSGIKNYDIEESGGESSNDPIIVTGERQSSKLADERKPATFPLSLRAIWESVFGPDDPNAGAQREALRKLLRENCKPGDPASAAVDNASAGMDVAAEGVSKLRRLQRGSGYFIIARSLAMTALCTHNGF